MPFTSHWWCIFQVEEEICNKKKKILVYYYWCDISSKRVFWFINYNYTHRPWSRPTPHTRTVWIGCVLSTVKFSGSINLSAPSSRSMKRSLPCNWHQLNFLKKLSLRNEQIFFFRGCKKIKYDTIRVYDEKNKVLLCYIGIHSRLPIVLRRLRRRFCRVINQRCIYSLPCYFCLGWDPPRRFPSSPAISRRILLAYLAPPSPLWQDNSVSCFFFFIQNDVIRNITKNKRKHFF